MKRPITKSGACYVSAGSKGGCLSRESIFRLVSQIAEYRTKRDYPGDQIPDLRSLRRDEARARAFLDAQVIDLPVYKDTMRFLHKNLPEMMESYSVENQTSADFWYRFIPGVCLDTDNLVSVRPLVPVNWLYCRAPKNSKRRKTLCSYAWLSNYDIDMVLGPYGHYYTNAVIFPADGCDFMDYKKYPKNHAIASYTPENMKKHGKDMLVFPLISHRVSNPASPVKHWFAACVSYDHARKTAEIAIYDSQVSSDYDFHKIARKSIRAAFFGDKSSYTVSYKRNKNEVQKRAGQCGMFTIDYLASRIRGVSADAYDRERKSDRSMETLRRKYFYFPGSD